MYPLPRAVSISDILFGFYLCFCVFESNDQCDNNYFLTQNPIRCLSFDLGVAIFLLLTSGDRGGVAATPEVGVASTVLPASSQPLINCSSKELLGVTSMQPVVRGLVVIGEEGRGWRLVLRSLGFTVSGGGWRVEPQNTHWYSGRACEGGGACEEVGSLMACCRAKARQ